MSGAGQDEEWLKGGRGRAAPVRNIRVAKVRHRTSGPSRTATGRIGTARGYGEAVVKVASFAQDRRAAMSLVDYVTRKGELAFLTKDGLALEGREGASGTKELVDAWSEAFRQRANARNAAHIVVSTPPGTDERKAIQAAIRFGQRAFADAGYDYGLAVHTDEAHPHAHFVVVRTGEASVPKLAWSKSDLQELREAFAEAAQEVGLGMVATPRAARGKTEKAERTPMRKARERDGVSRSDVRAAEAVLDELTGGEGAAPDRPWEQANARRVEGERAAYEALCAGLPAAAVAQGMQDDPAWQHAIKSVRWQAMALRHQGTRREHMVRLAKEIGLDHVARNSEAGRERAAEALARRYRADRAYREDPNLSPRQPVPTARRVMHATLEAFERARGRGLKAAAARGDPSAQKAVEAIAWLRETGAVGPAAGRQRGAGASSRAEGEPRHRAGRRTERPRERSDRDIGDDYEM